MNDPAPAAAPPEALTGLTSQEAAQRKLAGQANSVAWQSSRSFSRIVFENAVTPINVALFVISGVLVFLGLLGDAFLTGGLVLGNVIVGVFQEARAKRQLDRIALLNRPLALVIRDGREQEIAPEEIVLGDLLAVKPGDQVFVDGRVVTAAGLGVDESLLTGESDILPKRAGEDLVSGSYCLTGSGFYEAVRVGAETTASQITVRARQNRVPRTPLQREVGLVLWTMSLVVAFLAIIVIRSFRATDGGVPVEDGVRAAAVIVALVPQGLAVMVTVSYALAAVRMSKTGVLIQHMNAIESISHVDVLCLDKTGTLTTNRLTVEQVEPYGIEEAELQQLLGGFAASASFRNRTADALQEAFEQPARPLADEVAFDSSRKWSGLVYEAESEHGALVLGGADVLAPHTAQAATITQEIEEWTERGLRVLLLASSAERAFPRQNGEPSLPGGLTALGLVILRDEMRQDAAEVIAEFGQAGIELKVISGDHPETVATLASQAGLSGRSAFGADLEQLDDAALAREVNEAAIFGRVSPQTKERIVQSLRRGGRYVAMVGDGVNDVPALKAAQVAIALRSGSAITRDIADMVLLTDAFSSLPRGLVEGQRIRKGMESIFRVFLTRTLSLTLVILFVSLLNDPFPVTPRHTAMIALLTVGIPTLFLAVWAKPGQTDKLVIFSASHFVVPAALSIAAVGVLIYEFFLQTGDDVELARTALTFTAAWCGLLVLLFLDPPSPAWVAANPQGGDWRHVALVLGLFGLFVAFLAVPWLRDFYELKLPDAWGFGVIAVVVFAWAIVLRAVWRFNLHRVLDLIPRPGKRAVSAQPGDGEELK